MIYLAPVSNGAKDESTKAMSIYIRPHKLDLLSHMFILLIEETLQQLRLVFYPIIYRVLYIPGGCLGFPSIKNSSSYLFFWSQLYI